MQFVRVMILQLRAATIITMACDLDDQVEDDYIEEGRRIVLNADYRMQGTGQATQTDAFSEKFQMAFDRPPPLI